MEIYYKSTSGTSDIIKIGDTAKASIVAEYGTIEKWLNNLVGNLEKFEVNPTDERKKEIAKENEFVICNPVPNATLRRITT